MRLRERPNDVKYASESDSQVSEASDDNTKTQGILVVNQRRRKVQLRRSQSSPNGTDNPAAAKSLLRYAKPNINNTIDTDYTTSKQSRGHTADESDGSAGSEDSDEDFVDLTATKMNNHRPIAVDRSRARGKRKIYKEISSSSESDGEYTVSPRSGSGAMARGRSTLCTREKQTVESKTDLVSAEMRSVKVTTSDSNVRSSEEDLEGEESTDENDRFTPIKGSDVSADDPRALTGKPSVGVAPKLIVDRYGLRIDWDAKVGSLQPKRLGQVEKILSVRNRNTANALYCVKELGKSFRNVVAVRETHLQSHCPQLLRNFVRKMDELQRVDGHTGDREDITPFDPSHLQIERVIAEDNRKGDRRYFLVKWRGLPYGEATWELQSDLSWEGDKTAIDRFLLLESSPRKTSASCLKIEELIFKDGRKLRDYQEKGLAWMDHNFHCRVNCILADEMGLGKTMQAVSMLENLRVKRMVKGPFLVIAPVSTLGHWQREVESLTDMNCVVYSGSAEDRSIIRDYEVYYPKSQGLKFNVLLTSFEILLKDVTFLSKHDWRYVIVDEAHRLKSKDSKTTRALKQLSIRKGGLLLLTGTPVQNNTKELFSLLNVLDPEKFNSEEDFLQKYGDLKIADQVRDLQDNILRPRLLRRLKDDVEKSIPLKEETIIWVELTNEQRYYYKAIFENRILDLLKGSQSSNIPNLRNIAMELRKLCNHPYLCNGLQEELAVKLNSNGVKDETSLLCLSSGKMMLLDKLLPMLKSSGHRVLIFSQFAIMLDLLEDYLVSRQYSYEKIDGSVRGSDRQAAIDRYSAKDSDIFVFLLSTRAGGVGITLTAADTCIIYDSDWNPQNDLQAMARCHRIGQKKDVRIYRLITRNTYEQHLFECSSRKYGLDEAILGSMQGTNPGAELNANIENLLKRWPEDGEAEAAAFHSQNIDQILESRTEKRQVGGRSNNTFSVATFTSNPVQDSDENPAPADQPVQSWEDLLPEACASALNNDKTIETSYGPRKRSRINYNERPEMSDHEIDDEPTNRRGRRSTKKKDAPEEDVGKQWTEKEIRQLEGCLSRLGSNRAEQIMAEAGLEHHGIQEVQQLSNVLIQMFKSLNGKSGQSADQSLDVLHFEINQTDKTETSYSPLDGKEPVDVQSKENEDSPTIDIMGPEQSKLDIVTVPLYAKKVLQCDTFLNKLQKRVARNLQALHEREVLAKCVQEGKIVPPFARRIKKLPSWWGDAEDVDLLLGAHKHGHRDFDKIRDDATLCFQSRLTNIKTDVDRSTSDHEDTTPVEEAFDNQENDWPHDSVLTLRLRKLIQGLEQKPPVDNVIKESPKKNVSTCNPENKQDKSSAKASVESKTVKKAADSSSESNENNATEVKVIQHQSPKQKPVDASEKENKPVKNKKKIEKENKPVKNKIVKKQVPIQLGERQPFVDQQFATSPNAVTSLRETKLGTDTAGGVSAAQKNSDLKRKNNNEGSVASKKLKQSGKQQTLLGFLSPKGSISEPQP